MKYLTIFFLLVLFTPLAAQETTSVDTVMHNHATLKPVEKSKPANPGITASSKNRGKILKSREVTGTNA